MPLSDKALQGRRSPAVELVAQICVRVRADLGLYVAIAIYAVAGMTILHAIGHPEMASYSQYFGQWSYLVLLFMPFIAILIDWIRVMVRFDHKRSLAMKWVFSPQRLAHLFSGMALLAALMFFQGTFTSIKNALPLMRGGFLYDVLLADIDAWLSFGVDPWRRLYSFSQHDIVLEVLDWNYGNMWFLVCFGTLFFAVTSPRAAAVRVRYVTMFMLVWIVCGNVLAGIFISAGPAFYGAVTGDAQRFGEQLAFVASDNTASAAIAYQNYLWSLYQAGTPGFGSGISAFPSVHVGLVAMNAFFAAEVSRRLGIIAFGYLAVVMVSSVYLGWHYAIDGYASIVVVALCHFGVKWLMQPDKRRTSTNPPVATTVGA